MLKFNAGEFIDVLATFSDISMELEKRSTEDIPVTEKARDLIIPVLNETKKHCELIGLDLSIILIDEIVVSIQRDYKTTSLRESLNELRKRILHEIDSPLLLGIKRDKVKFFEDCTPFGENVSEKFPSANFDIEEASKCFALARYTSCVMHLQRVMEIGLRGYGRYFGILDLIAASQPQWKTVQPTWSDVLQRALKEFKDRDNKSRWDNPSERDFFDGLHPFLFAVKNAWRNPVMHAEKSYGEEITEDIFFAVKGFMHYLAEHLDEMGEYSC